MNDLIENHEARDRVLDAAERLFAEKGYAAVTLRDIAAAVSIRHTSLYHHFPNGKEELFVEVTERHLNRHQQGLTRAIAQASDLRAQLYAVADWLLSQPPMDLVRIMHSDMPAIDPEQAERLSLIAYTSMLSPISTALQSAQQKGEIEQHNLDLLAGGILGMIEILYAIPAAGMAQVPGRQVLAYELIDVLLNGLRSHSSDR